MKSCSLLFLIACFSAITGLAQERSTAHASGSQRIPKVVTIKMTLLNSPGVNDAGSRWENAYELRMANEAAFYEANHQGKFKAGSQTRVGELIAKGGLTRKSLRGLKNRSIVLQIPLSREIQMRLRDQPRDRIKLTAATATADNIRLSKEHEKKAQVFFFYLIANFYDAKLKKNVIVPVKGIWLFDRHPTAEFEIKFEVTENGARYEST